MAAAEDAAHPSAKQDSAGDSVDETGSGRSGSNATKRPIMEARAMGATVRSLP